MPKMLNGRFISIILKMRMKKLIGDKEAKVLNVNKNLKKKLLDNWKRN